MKQKSIKNIRQEFKDNGIFYTPPELAEKLKSYMEPIPGTGKPPTAYDPTCGAGNLLKVFPIAIQTYGQELDPEQLALIDIPGFNGYAGDTLTDDGFAGMEFDYIVANPPFSIRWEPDKVDQEDPRFNVCPVLPPPSKADWAFMLHILHHLAPHGVAAVLEFPGILYRGQREGKVRQWFVEQNVIDRIVNIPGNTFEDTSIATCIIVLKKDRHKTSITFEDGDRTREVPLEEIESNNYTLSVNTYLPDEIKREEVDIDSINRQVATMTLENVKSTLETLIELQKAFPDDNFYVDEMVSGLKEIVETAERSEA